MIRSHVIVAILAGALALLGYLATVLVGDPIGSLYRAAPDLATARAVAHAAAIIASAGLFVAATIVAVPTALQPGVWRRRLLLTLPLFLLILTLMGVVTSAFGIGTVGNIAESAGIGNLTFARVWLALGLVLSAIAAAIAVARANLPVKTLARALTALSGAAVISLVSAAAIVASAAIVATSQPRAGPPRAQDATSAQRSGAPVQGVSPGAASARTRGIVRQFAAGASVMLVATLIMVFSVLRAWPAARVPRPSTLRVHDGDEMGRVIGSLLALGIATLLVIQLVPISRVNPPAQTAVQWTSPDAQHMWNRACADCHSNETNWPWYAKVAPSSWLTASHVHAGRDALNISELNALSGARRRRLPEESEEQIDQDLMPPRDYLFVHPEARLSEAEKKELAQALRDTLLKSLK